MFIHAACLLLWREVLDALAKPTELLGRLLARWAGALVDFLPYMLFFGWQRTITLRRWHRLAATIASVARLDGAGTARGRGLT